MEEIEFESRDGLLITADYYKVENPKSLMLLCHRSHCNRAEYRETAPKFNQLGYSCLAIDQRSGMKIFGAINKTKIRAKEQGLATGYLDARPDIEAAIDYAYQLHKQKKIILIGSSYSAALALLIAPSNKKIKAIAVFSAAEHLKGVTIKEALTGVEIPIYATSAKKEILEVEDILLQVDKKYITHFRPQLEGFHGSKILWKSVKGYEEHWKKLKAFLDSLE